jgi:lysophospholipase III
MNGDQPITFIAHSMGAPMLMIFLQRQSDSWKDKHIARMITIAGAWGGSAKTVKVFAVGDDLGAFALRAATMREEQISMPSLAFLLPFPAFWKPNEVLVKTRTRTYTYSQLQEFFEDLGYPNGWEMRKDNYKYVENFAAPNVEIHCLFGSQINTVEV